MGEANAIKLDSRPHQWFVWRDLTCCRLCGIVRNETSDSRPCKGPVKAALRDEEADPKLSAFTMSKPPETVVK